MAVPKKKLSNARANRRRGHLNLTRPVMAICSNCQNPILPHTVCSKCGYYRGQKVDR